MDRRRNIGTPNGNRYRVYLQQCIFNRPPRFSERNPLIKLLTSLRDSSLSSIPSPLSIFLPLSLSPASPLFSLLYYDGLRDGRRRWKYAKYASPYVRMLLESVTSFINSLSCTRECSRICRFVSTNWKAFPDVGLIVNRIGDICILELGSHPAFGAVSMIQD